MPYIKQLQRYPFTPALISLITELEKNQFNEGELNYCITRLLLAARGSKPNYARVNKIMGVLACVQQEFYRRVAAPYEDEKIQENGDVI